MKYGWSDRFLNNEVDFQAGQVDGLHSWTKVLTCDAPLLPLQTGGLLSKRFDDRVQVAEMVGDSSCNEHEHCGDHPESHGWRILGWLSGCNSELLLELLVD